MQECITFTAHNERFVEIKIFTDAGVDRENRERINESVDSTGERRVDGVSVAFLLIISNLSS